MIQRPRTGAAGGVDGFTLIETLVALLLLGMLVGLLGGVTGEWLPNWKRGLVRARSNEKAAIALDRLVTDLSAAQYVSMLRQSRAPLFDGDEHSVTFVRSAIGPNGSRGLDIVRIAEITDKAGYALVRMQAPFRPQGDGDHPGQIPFADPVVLFRAPLRIAFGFAGYDGKWLRTWHNGGMPPAAVRFVVHNEDADRPILISTAVRIHVDMMAPRPEEMTDVPADTASASPNPAGAKQ